MDPVRGAAPALAAGCSGNTSYAIDTAGMLHAWGDNAFGQAGVGSLAATSAPVVVPIPAGATAWTLVAPGERHCLALADDGFLYAWGDHSFGQLGAGEAMPLESRVPVRIPFPPEVAAWRLLASGSFHSLAVSDRGQLFAWGDNRFGQLGLGSTNPVNRPTPVTFPAGVTNWVSIAGGGYHSLAVADDGTLFSWGRGTWGQLGVPLPVGEGLLAAPTRLGGRWQSVAAGQFFSLALDDIGRLAFWGRVDPFTRIDGPLLSGPSLYARIVAGGEHYLAISHDGVLYGAGSNDQGQSGFGDAHAAGVIFPQPIPAADRPLHPFAVAAGRRHSLALGTECALYAFGTNSHGQLGLPQAAAPAPAQLTALTPCVEHVPYLPEVSLTVSGSSLSEYQGRDLGRLPMVRIARSGDRTTPLSVSLAYAGTAVNGIDYRLLPPSVMIPAGASDTSLTIRPIDDRLVEGEETIEVRVLPPACLADGWSNLGCYVPGPNDRVLVRLEDAESGPFALPQVSWLEPAEGTVLLAPASLRLRLRLHDDNGWIIRLDLFQDDELPQWVSIIREFPTPGETDSYTWFYPALGPGFYSWTVLATDDQLDTNSSATLHVVVVEATNSPLLSALAPVGADELTLRLHGQVDRRFFVQESGDLLSWSLLMTNRFINPSFEVPIDRPRADTQRFYRAFYGP